MKWTLLKVIMAVNIAILMVIFVAGYGLGGHTDELRFNTMLAPFLLSVANLALGLVCVVALIVFGFINKAWRDVADKLMQGFMIAFGLTLVIAVPACFAGLGFR